MQTPSFDPVEQAQLLERLRRTTHLAALVGFDRVRIASVKPDGWSSPAADGFRELLAGIGDELRLAEAELLDAVELLRAALASISPAAAPPPREGDG